MGPIQRARLGLTLPQLAARARRLRAAGVEVTAENLMADLLSDADAGDKFAAGADWETILKIIMDLLPVILQIIRLFP